MTQLLPCDWVPAATELQIRDLVERLFRGKRKPELDDRRRGRRVAYPHLLTVTPIDDAEIRTIASPITVVGKYLAWEGLDFYHSDSLPYRRVVVSLDEWRGRGLHFVLNISWCRFLRAHWYDSGGRFTHVVRPAPIAG